MWKVTGDARWRQRGWLIYQAIERETRTDAGYAILQSVAVKNSLKDEMPRSVHRITITDSMLVSDAVLSISSSQFLSC